MAIADIGNLYVTQDSTPVPNRQLLASKLSDPILRLDMRAVIEDIRVEEIRFSGIGGSVEELVIEDADSSTELATARELDCTTQAAGTFCAKVDFTVEADQERTLAVRARVESDQNGAESGETVTATIPVPLPDVPSVKATGVGSQTELSINDGNGTVSGEVIIGRDDAGPDQAITGPTNDIVLAKMIRIEDVNTDEDGTAVPSGHYPIARYEFFSAAHENSQNGLNSVEIQDILFTVAATNVEFEAGSFHIYNVGSSSTQEDCTESAVTGTITVTCSSLHNKDVSTEVEVDDSIQIVLRGNITNPRVNAQAPSNLQVSLNDLSSRTSGGTIEWSDGITTFDWVDIGETTVPSTAYQR
jgi:hypothetical protein